MLRLRDLRPMHLPLGAVLATRRSNMLRFTPSATRSHGRPHPMPGPGLLSFPAPPEAKMGAFPQRMGMKR